MKKLLLSALFLTVSFSSLFSQQKPVVIQPTFDVTDPANRALYEQYIESHPFSNRPHLNKTQVKALKKGDRPDQGWEQDFLRTMDPQLGRPAPERLTSVYNLVAQYNNTQAGIPGSATVPWVERGPNNVGGRTRAITFDPNDATNKKVWAGGVTGGLWYNNDITSSSSQWIAVNDFWDNLAVTAIAFDPNNSQIIYVGTGEGWGTGSSRGAGVWKSTNGGSSFSQLSATADFYYVNDLVVRNESGSSTLYVGVSEFFYQGQWQGTATYYQGMFRSTNGGTSFSQVMPSAGSAGSFCSPADIEIGANNRIWVGTRSNSYGEGGGRIYYSDNGTAWTLATNRGTNGRVELACAPSDSNTVYALIESSNTVAEIIKTTNSGSTWISSSSSSAITEPADADTGIPSGDFTRGQAWYDLVLAVSPSNASTIYVGGIDLFRSSNAGLTWSQISKWSNNNNLFGLSCPLVHADQHAFIFRPGATNEALIGNDGGVYYASNLSGASTSSTAISDRNSNYNVTQYYACAISPTASSNVFLAGAQDNGTQRYNAVGVNATTEVNGGDGAYCFIDQDNPNLAISSYVYNTFDYSTNGGVSFNTNLISDDASGSFINPADYDDNMNILYSCKDVNTIYRISNLGASPTIATVTISGMSSKATNIKVSPFTTASTKLFIGTAVGSLYRVTAANSGTNPAVSNITGAGFPAASISSIEFGSSENEIIVTFFNYGVTSVWYTSNGGTSWTSKEGNLPDMPVRWSLMNPANTSEVILATEVGIWSTQNFQATSPTWVPSNSGLANVRVDMLQTRTSDNEVIAATYGRGLFSSSFQNAASLKNVTFQVDMHGVPSITAVNVAGSFQSTAWTPGATSMTDANGDSIYDVTVQLDAGTYEYKFLKGGSWGLDETVPSACGVTNGGGGFNRQIVVVNDTTIPALCYSSCNACSVAATTYNVTFRVGMQGVAGIDSVNVAGNFQSPAWTAGANLMTDANNDSIWEVTVPLQAGTYEYKFLADGNWGVSENVPSGCAINGNRGITITGDTVLPAVCYSTCNVCAPYVAPSISVSTLVTNALCFGNCNGLASTTVSNAVGTVTYVWSNSATTASVSNLCAGTYYVTVTDSLGNAAIDTLMVTEPSALSSLVLAVPTSFAGALDGGASVSVSGGTSPYSYLWSNTSTAASISNVGAGTYYVTITDANSCSILDTAVVQDGAPLPTYNVTFRVGMQGIAGIDSVNVAGDFQNPQWTPGATLMTDANNDSIWEVTVQLPAGTYEYKFLADGYWGADETVPAGCAVSVANRGVTITGDTVLPAVCYGTCNVCAPSVAPFTLTLSGADQACSYLCNASVSATITGVGPFSIQWINQANSQTIGNIANLNGLCAGSYKVTVVDSSSMTTLEDSITIGSPSAIQTTLASTNINCFGDSTGTIGLTTSGGYSPYTYAWTTGDTSATITGLSAGSYDYTVTDNNGCTYGNSVTITQPATAIQLSLVTANVTSFGGNDGYAKAIVSGGTPSYTYSWSNGAVTDSIGALYAGIYTICATDTLGCQICANATIQAPQVTTYNVTFKVGVQGVSNVAGVNVVGTFQSPNWGIGNTLMTDANNDSIYEVTVQLPAGYYEYQFLSDINWNTQETVPMACGVFNGTNLYNRFFTVTGDTVLPAVCFSTCNVCAPYVQAFTVAASKTNVTCFGTCNGTASVVTNGASSSVSYNWTEIGTVTSVGNTASVAGLCAATYVVAVYDSVAMQTQLDTVVISQPSLINPSFVTTTTSAIGMPDGAVTTTVTGGVGPYTYNWSNGQSTANLTNVMGGSYVLTVTDASGCQVVDTAVVPNGTGPQVYAVTFRVGMSGVPGIDSVNVAGSFQNPAWTPGATLMTDANNDSIWEVLVYLPADTFAYKFLADAFWGSDETVPTACGEDDGAGIYNRIVIVTGDTILPPVCFATCNVCAPIYAPLQATITADSISCFGTCDGELNVTVTGGSGMFVYQWKNTTTNSIISTQAAVTNLCAASYRVYINDTLALTTDSFDITLGQPALLVTSNSSTNPTNNLTCDGNAGVVASGGSMPYAFTWSTGGNTSNLSALCNGTYTVTTTDTLGCFVIDTFVLTSPMVTVTVPLVLNDTICVGTTAVLLASGATNGATYLWFADAAANDTLISGSTLSLAGLTSDSTVYVAIDSATALSALVPVTAFVNPNPSLSLGADVVTCASSYVIAAPTGFASYAWNNGGIASNDTALTSGSYSLTITDANSCSANDTVLVTLNSALVATLNAVADVCIDAASFAVSGGLPTGGDYLVDGVASTVINPSALGVGVHTVSYIIADTCGADTATVSFQINALPVVDLGSDTTICLGATITLSAPVVMQSYFWSTAATVSSITVSSSSNYGVTVTDTNGCSNNDLISISVNQLLASNTAVNNATCGLNNGTATVDITPLGQTYTYNWSNAATSDSISGLAAGTYYVTATNTAGCSVSDSVVITNNGAIALTTSLLDATCFGSTDGSATVAATGGGTAYTYLWSNAVNTAANSGIAAGTYSVTVTSNTGCVESDTITLNQSAAIQLTGVIIDASCGANDGAAIASASGGNSPYSYSWSNGSTSASITNVGAGCYSVTITDIQGCSADTTLCISNVGAGSTTATIYDVTCLGNTDGSAKVSMVGGVSPFTYNWSTIPAQTTDSVSGLSSGLYTVTVTDFTGCISIASVQVNTQFTAPTISLPANLVACFGQASIITAPTATSYLWSTNATTQSISTFSAGNYSVTITDANGCTAADTTTVTINQLPVVALTNFSSLCNNSSNLALSGGTPTGGVYSGIGVNNGSFNPSIAGVGTFNITYTYTDANGCSNASSKPIIVNAAPTVSHTALSSMCVNNNAITLSGGTPSGGVYSGPGVSSGNFNPLVAGVGTHNIIYQYTNASGCASTATQTLTVNAAPTVTLAAFAGVCINSGSVVLSGGSPSGGIYSGLGVSSGVFQPSIAGVGSHVITYSVTNAFGCSATATKTIVVNSLPTVTFASLSGVCANGSAFTLSGGFPTGGVYSGAGVVSNQFFPANAGLGTHILTYTYTNANGCISSDTSQIAVLTLPVVVQAPIAGMCENANPVLLTGGSPAGGNYSGNGVSTGIFNPASAGVGNHSITYTYTDSYGCQGTAGTTVTVGTLPSINFNPLGTVCFNAPTFQLTGATPLNGIYSGAGVVSNQFTAANAGVGVHTIAYTYTSATGCSNTVTNTITVNPLPSVTFAGALNVCQNDNQFPMQGGFPSGGVYSGTGISNGVFNPAVAGVGAHNAQYTYIDANGCSNYNTTTINVYALPTVQTSNDTSICVGETVSMAASGGVYYVWSNGIVNATNTVSPISTTTYIVTVSSLNGCTNTGDVKVTVVSSPVVNLGADRNICEGDQTVLNAGPGFSQYLWQNGFTVQAITVNTSGQYYVTVKNSTGCVGSDTVSVVVRQNPVVNLGNDTLICTEVTPVYALNAGNGFASYNWNNGAWFLQSYNITQSGTYSVEVKDNFGCIGSDAIVVTMEQCNVGVDEVFASNTIKVYPTPFTNTITLQAEHPFATNLLVSVMDVTGRMVHYTQLDAGNETLQLDLSNLPPGMYILKASNSIESQSFRVIKQ